MVKKGKEKATAPPPQASASSSKKPAKPSKKPPQEDDFIVFTNSTTDSKPKRGGQGASRGKAPEGEEIPTGPPKPTVKQIASRVAASDYRFSSLVLEIVKSLPFQMRREIAGSEALKR